MSDLADIAQVVTAVAAVIAVIASILVARGTLKRTLLAHWNIEGAMWAAQWREHVLKLHDRGLSVEQIRELVSKEKDQVQKEGYLLAAELGSGKIDDIVRLANAAATGSSGDNCNTRLERGTRMAGQDWQTLAEEVLRPAVKPDELVTARTSDITKLGATVSTLVAALLTTLFGANFVFNGQQVESVLGAALIVSTCVFGVLMVYAADFRTRGHVASARFDALAQIAQQHVTRDVTALRAKLAACEAEDEARQTQLVEKLVTALEKSAPSTAEGAATTSIVVSLEDLVKALKSL